jgi:hypothetical protein
VDNKGVKQDRIRTRNDGREKKKEAVEKGKEKKRKRKEKLLVFNIRLYSLILFIPYENRENM